MTRRSFVLIVIANIMANVSPLSFSNLEYFTESELAKVIADYYSDDLRFDHKRQRFLVWREHYWKEDKTGTVSRWIQLFSKLLIEAGKEKENKIYISNGIKLQSHAKIKNITNLLKITNPLPLSGSEFDREPLLLGVTNGIIDLSNGKLRDGDQEDYISQCCPVVYSPNAPCPLWDSFIETVFDGDDTLIHYVQRALGYSLTGSMAEQLVFICYGKGSNGKSQLFHVIKRILGDYAYTAGSNLFRKNLFNTQTNDLAEIEGKRFISNGEALKEVALDEERIKSISGGDEIRARLLNQNNISFHPVGKIWLYSNDYPKFEDDSYGAWRRIRTIPFLHQFPPEERIPDYGELMFKKEGPGILRWLVEGCLMWQKETLTDIPMSISSATNTFKNENNPLKEYLEERIIVSPEDKVQTSTLYSDYQRWSAKQHTVPLSLTAFGRKMNETPYEKKKEEAGVFYYGIRLTTSYL